MLIQHCRNLNLARAAIMSRKTKALLKKFSSNFDCKVDRFALSDKILQ
jgi:hypothetical protein